MSKLKMYLKKQVDGNKLSVRDSVVKDIKQRNVENPHIVESETRTCLVSVLFKVLKTVDRLLKLWIHFL